MTISELTLPKLAIACEQLRSCLSSMLSNNWAARSSSSDNIYSVFKFCSGSGKLSEHVWLTFLSFHAPLFDNGGNIIVVIR